MKITFHVIAILLSTWFSLVSYAEIDNPQKSRASYWAEDGTNTTQTKEELPFIERKELFQSLKSEGKVVFLDTREQNEYEASHLPNAVHIPFTKVSEEGKTLPNSTKTTIIPYCNWDFRAYVAGVKLKEMGYSNVRMMYPHGLKGWMASGLPLAGKGPGKSDAIAQAELTKMLDQNLAANPYDQLGNVSQSRKTETKQITMRLLKKHIEPRHIQASVGDHLILNLSAEEEDHWFVIPDFGINLKLKQGEKKTVQINLAKSGYFPYGCISCCMRYQCQVRQAILADLKTDPSFFGE